MKKLLLIDGHSLLHRAFHALPEFTSPSGQPVGAVYGFARMLLSALKQQKPDSVIIAWDTAKPTFRHQMYVEYKQHRPETDDSLRQQIGLAQQLVEVFGIEQFFVEGYEADDVIATTIQKFKTLHNSDCQIDVLSSDMDMLQLVRDNVHVLAVRKGMSEVERFDTQAVLEKYELAPDQLPDLKGLMGDSSDNIPGVKGIGIKTATELLKRFETIENVYEHLTEITGKPQTLLSHQHEMAVLSKELATIRDDAPIQIAQDANYTFEIDQEGASKLFQEHGFKSLIALLTELSGGNNTTPSKKATGMAYVVKNLDEAFWKEAKERTAWYVDFQTGASSGLSVFWETQTVWFISETLLRDVEVVKNVQTAIKDVQIIGYDIKALMHWLSEFGITIYSYVDLLVIDAMVQRGRGDKTFDEALFTHLGMTKTATSLAHMPALYTALIEKLESVPPVKKIVDEIEMPLVGILYRMEKHGVLLDQQGLAHISQTLRQKQEQLEQEIYDALGHRVNVQSPKQLEVVLFDELGLPVIKRTKTQRSTNEAVLQQLVHAHPVVQKILDYRGVAKLTSTYTEKLPELADEDSRIHTTYNQLKVVTARLSSENPNLQNIPRDKTVAIRSAFVAAEGYKLVALDYSQIELRILAHLSQDTHLQDSFRAGQDIHTATAAKLFNTFVDEIADRQRQIAKVVNFAVMYGMGPHALSENLDIEFVEARKYIDDFFEFYPEVKKWRDDTIAFARTNGYVETLWGRVIDIPEIMGSNKRLAAAGERMATNYPNQGTQADLIKKAMVEADDFLKKEGLSDVHMIMQVHDELVFEIPEEQVTTLAPKLKEIMEQVIELAVPVVVDCKAGANWQETEKI